MNKFFIYFERKSIFKNNSSNTFSIKRIHQ